MGKTLASSKRLRQHVEEGARPRPTPRKSVASRSYAGVAQEQRQQLRRERLVQAGIEVFGRSGYHAATVRLVCGQAQLTERYFYESFKSLDELFTAVIAELNNQLRQATVEALSQAGQHPLELVQAALRVFLQFIQQDSRHARIILIDAVSMGRIGQAAVDAAARGYIEMMGTLLTLLYPQAEQRGVQADMLAAGLVGLNIHVAMNWVREDFRTPLEQVLWNNLLPYRGLAQLMETDQLPLLKDAVGQGAAAKADRPARKKAQNAQAGASVASKASRSSKTKQVPR